MDQREVLRVNRRVYDAMAAAQVPLCRPATEEELQNPLATVDGSGWLGKSIAGKHLLCLAAGGGRQSSLYAAAGAVVTVVDLSGAMLELDRRAAAERGFSMRLLETSMEDLSMLRDGEFDIVIHPVSSCYIPNVQRVYAEVARVTRSAGLYISQHKQPTSLQASLDPNAAGCYELQHSYYRNSAIPAVQGSDNASKNARRLRESGAIEFLHRWEQLIGGMCRSGFVIEDLSEPMHARDDAPIGSFAHRAKHVAPYVRIKARRKGTGGETTTSGEPSLWLP